MSRSWQEVEILIVTQMAEHGKYCIQFHFVKILAHEKSGSKGIQSLKLFIYYHLMSFATNFCWLKVLKGKILKESKSWLAKSETNILQQSFNKMFHFE